MQKKPVPIEKKNTLCVILPDGMRILIENRAKKDGLRISDIVRMALRKFLGI